MFVRVIVCPGLGFFEVFKFGDDQAAAESGFAGVFAINRWMRASEYKASFVEQGVESFEVGRACFQSFGEAVFYVLGDAYNIYWSLFYI